jgi:hypothetical protein
MLRYVDYVCISYASDACYVPYPIHPHNKQLKIIMQYVFRLQIIWNVDILKL